MNTQFPQQNKAYQQTNRSNILGNLWSTMGLDFQNNLGAIEISPRYQVLTKTGDANASTLGCPVGFKYYDGGITGYWTVAGTRVYVNATAGGKANSAFVQDVMATTSSDYTSDYSDIEVFNSRLWTTAPTKLRSTDGTTWTDRETFVATSVPHPLSYFRKFDRLYYGFNTQIVGSIDTSNTSVQTGDYTLTIDSVYQIRAIITNSAYVWIAVFNSATTGAGAVIQWDGISAQPTAIYSLKARAGLALVILDDIPYVMDSEGVFSSYTGSSFSEVGRLPNKGRLTGIGTTANDRFIHPNGLFPTKNATILALINNLNDDTAGTVDENLPSGLWEWARGIGFTHKRPFTYNSYGSSTITDFGQNRVSRIGGLAQAVDSLAAGLETTMAGATYFSDASNTLSGIFIENTIDTVQKKGYFVTTFFQANEAEENWTRIWTTYRRFLDSADSIVFKYRNTEVDAVSATITWVDTTHFTTTTDVSAYAPTATGFDGTYGGEVEVTQGTGSGSCSTITSVVNNAGTYTVTLSSAVTGVTTGTAKARFQKWIRIGSVDSARGLVKSWQQLPIANSNENRIQIKCCMTFTGNGEFYSIIINSSTNVKITS